MLLQSEHVLIEYSLLLVTPELLPLPLLLKSLLQLLQLFLVSVSIFPVVVFFLAGHLELHDGRFWKS